MTLKITDSPRAFIPLNQVPPFTVVRRGEGLYFRGALGTHEVLALDSSGTCLSSASTTTVEIVDAELVVKS